MTVESVVSLGCALCGQVELHRCFYEHIASIFRVKDKSLAACSSLPDCMIYSLTQRMEVVCCSDIRWTSVGLHSVTSHKTVFFETVLDHVSLRWSLSFRIFGQIFLCISHLLHTCHMPYPSLTPGLDHANNTRSSSAYTDCALWHVAFQNSFLKQWTTQTVGTAALTADRPIVRRLLNLRSTAQAQKLRTYILALNEIQIQDPSVRGVKDGSNTLYLDKSTTCKVHYTAFSGYLPGTLVSAAVFSDILKLDLACLDIFD
jgi:hypothetical protein